MKRIRTIDGVELYDLIRSEDNIRLAIKNACKDHARDPAVIRIKEDPEPYVEATKNILDNQAFHYSNFNYKTIFERGKWRNLCYTRTYPDRVVQHAVMQIVSPILLGTCIRDTYAAIPEKGLHAGCTQIKKDLRADPDGTAFCLKLDVHHYFPSIKRDILYRMVKDKIKCPRTLRILRTMIYGCPGDDGLPIGLYTSQIFSAFYLSEFDHYCKEKLGIKHYYRYMDDIVILANNALYLRRILGYIRMELDIIGLAVKGNWQIFPVDKRGLDFMGYVFHHTHTRVRKRNKLAYRRVCNHIVRNIKHRREVSAHMMRSKVSYEGLLCWCDSRKLIRKYHGMVDIAVEFGDQIYAAYRACRGDPTSQTFHGRAEWEYDLHPHEHRLGGCHDR